MKQEKYMPLRIVEGSQKGNGTDFAKMLRQKGLIETDSLEEYTEFLFSRDFCNPNYKGPCKNINHFAFSEKVQDAMIRPFPGIKNNPDNLRTELRDIFGIPAVLELWAKNKQVYKIDREFFEELRKTENLRIPEGAFRYMPVGTFYIDMSECEGIDPLAGAFVHIVNQDQVVIYMETLECTTFSYYSDFHYEDGVFDLPVNAVPNTPFVAVDMNPSNGNHTTKSYRHDHRSSVIRAIIQVLMFLSSERPDISESPATKHTYRPGNIVRNKFSEVQMWDVGVRYGKAITIAKKQAEKTVMEHTERNKVTLRKPPRPHIRCAHWQRFHVGPGRKEIRVNWVPPAFVCGDTNIPVTIHTVK